MRPAGRKPSFLGSPVFWIIVFSLVWAVIFGRNLLPILRGPPEWQWPSRPVSSLNLTLPFTLGLSLYVPVGLWLRGRRKATGLLVWGILGGLGLSFAAAHLEGDVLYHLYSITVSGQAEGWHMAATRIQNLSETLRDWPQFMQQSLSLSPHIDHSPPGIVILYYAAIRLLDRFPGVANSLAQPLRWQLSRHLAGYTSAQIASSWLGISMPVWTSLTVVPLYYLGRRVYGEAAGRWSALWWPLVPSVIMFAPLPNTLYPLPSLVAIGVLWEGLSKERRAWVVAAGFLISILTFLSFTFLPLLPFAGLLFLGAYWQKASTQSAGRPKWYWPIQMGLLFGMGLSLVWLVAFATTGLALWSIWQPVQQNLVTIAKSRPYIPWLTWNLNDYLMFTGWPVALLAIMAIWSGIRRLASCASPAGDVIMTVALALTLILTDIYGSPRGEWGRVMLFMSPWLLLAAGGMLNDKPAAGWALTVTQAIVAAVLVLSLKVITVEFPAQHAPVPPQLESDASASPIYTGGAVFGGKVQLETASARTSWHLGGAGTRLPALHLSLTWNTLESINVPYAYSLQPTSDDGSPLGPPVVARPFGDTYPMTCWKPQAAPLTDQVRVPLNVATTDPWWVDLAVIDPSTLQPLAVMHNSPAFGVQVRLGPIVARQLCLARPTRLGRKIAETGAARRLRTR